MAKAIVEVRSQKSVGSGSGFGGPDTYVAVQIVPDGVAPLKVLNSKVASIRGIEIKYFGEGYSKNTGLRSAYGQACAKAEFFAAKFNSEHKTIDQLWADAKRPVSQYGICEECGNECNLVTHSHDGVDERTFVG